MDPKTKELLGFWQYNVLKNWAYSKRTFVLVSYVIVIGDCTAVCLCLLCVCLCVCKEFVCEELCVWKLCVCVFACMFDCLFVQAFRDKSFPIESNQSKWISLLVDFFVDAIMLTSTTDLSANPPTRK